MERRGSRGSCFDGVSRSLRRGSRSSQYDVSAQPVVQAPKVPTAPTTEQILEGINLHGFNVEAFVARTREEMDAAGLSRRRCSSLRRGSTMSHMLGSSPGLRRDSTGNARRLSVRRASGGVATKPAPASPAVNERSSAPERLTGSQPADVGAPSRSPDAKGNSPKLTRWTGSMSPNAPRRAAPPVSASNAMQLSTGCSFVGSPKDSETPTATFRETPPVQSEAAGLAAESPQGTNRSNLLGNVQDWLLKA